MILNRTLERRGLRRPGRKGQGQVEYGLIVVLVILAALDAVYALGLDVSLFYDNTAADVTMVSAGQADQIVGGKPVDSGGGTPTIE